MDCPSCGYTISKVIDSRSAEGGHAIRRRRECMRCHTRFTTYERRGDKQIVVKKSDGLSEVFNEDKLTRGIFTACAKRNVSPERITHIVNSIEAELRRNNITEVQSKVLGDMVLSRLRNVDEVAYIRFASVYKDFQSVEEFTKAIKGM